MGVVFVYECFLIVPALSASFSFCVIHVSGVGVWDSFWYSRVIACVVGVLVFRVGDGFYYELVLCWKFSVEV